MLFINNHSTDIGLKFRTISHGPEIELVDDFIHEIPKLFHSKNNKLALFIEPLIDGAYPDLVLAAYNPKTIENWNVHRNLLEKQDFKIFENIRFQRGATSTELFKSTGHTYKTILQSIEKLYDANLIERKHGQWKSKPLKDCYSIKRLISIEAKMNEWKTLIDQADANQWFASESYALSSVKKPRTSTINKFKHYGIGLYSLSDQTIVKLNDAKKQSLPKSYMSWMFNEWIGRYITQH